MNVAAKTSLAGGRQTPGRDREDYGRGEGNVRRSSPVDAANIAELASPQRQASRQTGMLMAHLITPWVPVAIRLAAAVLPGVTTI